MDKDVIDGKPFSWIELPDYFIVSSNKCQHYAYRHSEDLDETSLLRSKKKCFLNAIESTAYEATKQTAFDTTLMERAEGQLKPLAQD